jgi:hypothetical protein
MRFFYVRQLNDEMIIKLEHVDTKEQLADVLVTFKDKRNFDTMMNASRGYDGRSILRDGEPKCWSERRNDDSRQVSQHVAKTETEAPSGGGVSVGGD